MPVDGNASCIKWVLIGASDKYLIGSFDGTAFTPESKVKMLKYGGNSYAGQSWSNTPDGRRIRTISACATIPGMPFASCMSILQKMSLQTVNGEVLLCVKPVPEIELLYTHTDTVENREVLEDKPFRMRTAGGAYDISLKVNIAEGANWSISLLGFSIDISTDKGLLTCMGCSAPLDCKKPIIELRILLDTIYAEIFLNKGSIFWGCLIYRTQILTP